VRRLGLSLVLLSAALLLPPSGAQAQVVVDPNSPAGKEYAIPLEQKRDEASGKKDAKSGDGQAALFGEGISQAGDDDTGSKGGKSGKAKKKQKGSKKDDSQSDEQSENANLAGGSGSGGGGGGPDEAGTSGALLTSGIALAVLLLGGGIAFLMRRGAFGTDA
jgi:hypothetical protein